MIAVQPACHSGPRYRVHRHFFIAQEEVWHALVCNAEFLLNDIQNEAVAEQLREKRRFYNEQVPLLTSDGLECKLQTAGLEH